MNEKLLNLPKLCYGTLCNKILIDFMDYHKIDKMPVPTEGDFTIVALEKIFRIILASIDETRRNEILKDAERYISDLPAHVKYK
jgi:hypothetical protein